MNTSPKWLALIRLRRRVRAAERLVAARREKAEAYRRQALHGPPLSEWEREAMYGAVEAERAKR